ncbi:phage tail sheath C-terminal domain-containing protein [Burkholderia singularis]|uniref:Phage tail sheath protein FI n=1 Tax=Burkholderia singularis TaxID=1503053 RepID=A0A238H873_9BURK|nr:phage tail sheath C-terminal domain-containing protein [Burkholderia singularis]SMG01529.1 Phage tail sheath protein FI [Burkholderia singularis]
MPVAVTYPGVYVQEISSGVRTIAGVATSIAAFVDFFAAGPMNRAVPVFSFADFERQFGGLDARSEASYAIQQFFLNGGTEAYVVRVSSVTPGNAAVAAAIAMAAAPGDAQEVLTATAASAGISGNGLRIEIDYAAADPGTQFNLRVTQLNPDGSAAASETFRNLIVSAGQANDAVATVNAGSQLIRLAASASGQGKRPARTGTVSGTIGDIGALKLAKTDTVDVTLSGHALGTTDALGDPAPTTIDALAQKLQGLLRGLTKDGAKPLANATVGVVRLSPAQQYLVVKAGTPVASDVVGLSNSADGLAKKLGFQPTDQNVQQYALGGAAVQDQFLPVDPTSTTTPPARVQQAGSDGTLDMNADAAGFAGGLLGDAAKKTGMQALLDVDLFNILSVPATMNLPDDQALAVAMGAIELCTARRAMYLLDVPQADANRDTVPAIMQWLDANATLRSRNAALYFPRVDIPDPINAYRPRQVSPSGTVAGLWARTDAARGVWKAPAGTEANLAGVRKLEYTLTDPENGVLNPLAINCLRVFAQTGPVCWGARTLKGADQIADDYKYIPIRRLALYIEESLFRGTQWVVFEPNDTPLWAQIRLNVGSFMQTLFRQGAFQGATPQQAYFVQCDASTNPQVTIDQGIVNIVVGFAPLKPAEFVVITVQQIAGQLAS